MLWHRQAIFESKGDKLSSSAESRIRTQGVYETQSSADWMPADKPTELSRIKLKNLNSTARPYDQQAFSPPDPTAIWHSHLALAIYIFVVVNFDALAQASDFRIERRQVVFLCWEPVPMISKHSVGTGIGSIKWQIHLRNWNFGTLAMSCIVIIVCPFIFLYTRVTRFLRDCHRRLLSRSIYQTLPGC